MLRKISKVESEKWNLESNLLSANNKKDRLEYENQELKEKIIELQKILLEEKNEG